MSVLSDGTRRYTLSILLTFALNLLTISQPRAARALDFTVSGTFRYVNSSSGSTYSFVRDALVAVYVNGSYANLGTTNSSGYFNIAVNNIPFNNFSVFIRVFAKRSDNKIDVKDSASATYYEQSASLNCNSCSTLSFGTTSIGGVYPARAFFIFDRLGVDTLAALAHGSVAWSPSANVSVSYPSASTQYSSNVIYIKGNNGLAEDDGYAASPIIHEYGHATMEMVYGSYPTVTGCSLHYFGATTTTSCAWTEG
jgi:hypothetical protein